MQTEVGLGFLYWVLHTCVTSRSRVTYCGKFLGMFTGEIADEDLRNK